MGVERLERVIRRFEKQGLIYYELEDYSRSLRVCSDGSTVKDKHIHRRGLFWFLMLVILFIGVLHFYSIETECPSTVKEEYCRLLADGNFNKVYRLQNRYPALLDFQDSYGCTALHWARFHGKSREYSVLVKRGINADLKTRRKWFKYEIGTLASQVVSAADAD